jgi:hypothetical protein
MNGSGPASVRETRRAAYREQNGSRGQGLDHRRIERLIEILDGVLQAGPIPALHVRHTAAVRASLADAAIARRIAREMGQLARKGA